MVLNGEDGELAVHQPLDRTVVEVHMRHLERGGAWIPASLPSTAKP